MEKIGENLSNPNIVDSNPEQIFPSWEEHQKELGTVETEQAQVPEEPLDEEAKVLKLAQLKAEMVEMVGGEIEEASEEKVKFGSVELPRSLLGEEKVLVDSLKERPKFDFIGRAKDKKIAWQLINEDNKNEEQIKNNFSPTVAKAFLDICHEDPDSMYRPAYARLFEALPIEVQESEFSKKEAEGLLNAFHESDTLMNKVACGMIVNLETEDNPDNRIDSKAIMHIARHERNQKRFKNGRPISDFLTKEVSQRLFEASAKTNVGKLDRAVAFLKPEQIFDQLEDLTNRDMPISDVGLFNEMIENSEEKNGIEQSKWRARYQVAFPPESRRLAEIDDNFYRDYTPDRARAVVAELDATTTQREQIGLSEAAWDSIRRKHSAVYEQVKGQPVDEETAMALKLFVGSGLMATSRGEINSLEEVKNIDTILAASAKNRLKEEDYDGARDFIGQYAFGMGMEEMAQSLVALGVMDLKRHKSLDEGKFEFGKDKFKIKDLYAIKDMSEEQRLLVLDAVALFGCKDSELANKLKAYEDNHVSLGEKGKLVDTIEKAKAQVSEKASESYSKFMQEKLQIGAREVAELDYEGSKVPVMKMEGNEFLLLIHRLGAFSRKNRENPAQWNDESEKGKRNVGYISTSAIANGSIRLANIEEKHYGDKDEVFYSFTNLGKGSIKAMCEEDAYTDVRSKRRGYEIVEEITTDRQDHFYLDPRELIKKNKFATMGADKTYKHNEVVLDRYSGDQNKNGGRLQPNQIVVFTDDPSKIGDLPKKHAAYFGIPILMVDPNRYK